MVRTETRTAIHTTNELLKELEISTIRGALHSLFHHTNINSFAKIVTSESVCLSRMDQMNDGTENFPEAKQTYAFCLSARPTENVGMWMTYGLPRKKAVRVRFPGKYLLDICSRNGGRVVVTTKDSTKSVEGTASLHYVGYVSRSGMQIRVRDEKFELKDCTVKVRDDVMNRLGSYIKLLGWEYEHEIRLVIRLDHPICEEKIILKIPEVIKGVLRYSPAKRKKLDGNDSFGMPSVIVGPWGDRQSFLKHFDDSIKSLQKEKGQNILNLADIQWFIDHSQSEMGLVRNSEFRDKIHLTSCENCEGKACKGTCPYYVLNG